MGFFSKNKDEAVVDDELIDDAGPVEDNIGNILAMDADEDSSLFDLDHSMDRGRYESGDGSDTPDFVENIVSEDDGDDVDWSEHGADTVLSTDSYEEMVDDEVADEAENPYEYDDDEYDSVALPETIVEDDLVTISDVSVEESDSLEDLSQTVDVEPEEYYTPAPLPPEMISPVATLENNPETEDDEDYLDAEELIDEAVTKAINETTDVYERKLYEIIRNSQNNVTVDNDVIAAALLDGMKIPLTKIVDSSIAHHSQTVLAETFEKTLREAVSEALRSDTRVDDSSNIPSKWDFDSLVVKTENLGENVKNLSESLSESLSERVVNNITAAINDVPAPVTVTVDDVRGVVDEAFEKLAETVTPENPVTVADVENAVSKEFAKLSDGLSFDLDAETIESIVNSASHNLSAKLLERIDEDTAVFEELVSGIRPGASSGEVRRVVSEELTDLLESVYTSLSEVIETRSSLTRHDLFAETQIIVGATKQGVEDVSRVVSDEVAELESKLSDKIDSRADADDVRRVVREEIDPTLEAVHRELKESIESRSTLTNDDVSSVVSEIATENNRLISDDVRRVVREEIDPALEAVHKELSESIEKRSTLTREDVSSVVSEIATENARLVADDVQVSATLTAEKLREINEAVQNLPKPLNVVETRDAVLDALTQHAADSTLLEDFKQLLYANTSELEETLLTKISDSFREMPDMPELPETLSREDVEEIVSNVVESQKGFNEELMTRFSSFAHRMDKRDAELSREFLEESIKKAVENISDTNDSTKEYLADVISRGFELDLSDLMESFDKKLADRLNEQDARIEAAVKANNSESVDSERFDELFAHLSGIKSRLDVPVTDREEIAKIVSDKISEVFDDGFEIEEAFTREDIVNDVWGVLEPKLDELKELMPESKDETVDEVFERELTPVLKSLVAGNEAIVEELRNLSKAVDENTANSNAELRESIDRLREDLANISEKIDEKMVDSSWVVDNDWGDLIGTEDQEVENPMMDDEDEVDLVEEIVEDEVVEPEEPVVEDVVVEEEPEPVLPAAEPKRKVRRRRRPLIAGVDG